MEKLDTEAVIDASLVVSFDVAQVVSEINTKLTMMQPIRSCPSGRSR
jgi:hypothetical protein